MNIGASIKTLRLRFLAQIGALLLAALAAALVIEQRQEWSARLALLLMLGVAFLLARALAERLELRMQRLVKRHEDLVESIDGIVWEADATSFQLKFISAQAERLLGYPVAEWFAPNFWTDHLHPDDREWASEYCLGQANKLASYELEYRFIASDGRCVWLHDKVAVIAENGRPALLRGLMVDVTTRRLDEDRVRRLLAEQETILQNALVGIVYLKHRQVVSCNRRLEEIFGYGPGELVGESTERLYASRAIFDDIGKTAYAALGDGRNHTETALLRRRDNSTFWGALTGRAIDSAHPQEGSIWIYADISERRQAEEEVHKLLRAVEQSPVSIVITDRQGRIEYVNPRFTRVSGYTLDEAIGRNPRFLQSGETPAEVYGDLWRTLLAGREWRGTLHNRRKDGSLFWEEVVISPILNERREITHILAVNEDVSERKRAEDALYASHDAYTHLLSTTLDGFWLTDADGNLLDVNATYIRQSGYSHEELLGMRIADLDAGEDAANVAEHIRRTVSRGNDQFETLHRRQDGSTWHVEVSASHRETGGGQFFVFLRDITARKQIQQQLEDHQQHLEDLVRRRTADLAAALEAAKVADRAKDAFLANVSHELRTPLNAVLGLSELASKACADPKQRETLDKIGVAGQTLLEIINDLLDLTKIAAGEMRFEATPFSLRRVVARLRSVMAHRAADKGLRLDEQVDDALPDVLVGDPLRVEQILLNLVNNAIKFTDTGRVAVRIGMGERTEQRIRLDIEVEDSGIGMTAEEISRLFKPFAQADVSMTRKHGGTGLGLSICKQLAESMDGSIEASSQPGRGTLFRASLWLGLGQACDRPADDASTAADLPARYPNARVLLVDDQPLNREVVFEFLGTLGIAPRMAGNGREALDILAGAGAKAFDLVLMDIQMPVMDGLTATREIRALPGFAELPIVAMTAHTMVHEEAVYRAAGMNDHIGKPFTMASFFGLLAKWLPLPADQPPASLPIAVAGSDPGLDLPPIPGLDVGAAMERFAGNGARYRHWLAIFVEESAAFATEFAALLASGDVDAALGAVHAFKGRVGMLGMSELHALAAAIEAAIGAGQATAAPRQQLSDSIEAMRHALLAAPAMAPAAPAPPTEPAAGAHAETPMPACIARLLVMLETADGNSAASVERCRDELRDTPWTSPLDAALAHARRFDFEAARRVLAGPI